VRTYYKNPKECPSPTVSPESGCKSIIYGWAIGTKALIFPPEAGLLLNDTDDAVSSIVLEVHYSNPHNVKGQIDRSGVRITWTENRRQFDAGVMLIGDPLINLPPIPPRQSLWEMETTCPEQCTSQWDHDIIVFAELFHLHQTGTMAWSTLWRHNGLNSSMDSLGYINRAEYYSYEHQHINYKDLIIKRGDRMNVHCVWDTSKLSTMTTMGLTITNEMCIDFIFYYPALLTQKGHLFSFCGLFMSPQYPTFCGSLTYPAESLQKIQNPIPDLYFCLRYQAESSENSEKRIVTIAFSLHTHSS